MLAAVVVRMAREKPRWVTAVPGRAAQARPLGRRRDNPADPPATPDPTGVGGIRCRRSAGPGFVATSGPGAAPLGCRATALPCGQQSFPLHSVISLVGSVRLRYG